MMTGNQHSYFNMKKAILKVSLLFLCSTASLFSQVKDDTLFDENRKLNGLNERWDLTSESSKKTFTITPYKPIYVLPGRWFSRPNEQPMSLNPSNSSPEATDYDNWEIKFQISFKTKVAQGLFDGKGDVWVGFTQTANWQAYNGKESRPFRELNYEPEVIFNYPLNFGIEDFRFKMAGFAFNHQSNGKSLPTSRSWNRFIMHLGMEYHNWTFMLRPWIKFHETFGKEDNPRIEEYIGKGELTVVYSRENGQMFTFMMRNNMRLNSEYRGFTELTWAYPIKHNLKAFIVVNNGYGDSMIDYNWNQSTVGVGITLMEWL